MIKLIFISGPCGTGKSTFANAYAKHLVKKDGRTVYVIHGDDFHGGFVEPDGQGELFDGGEAAERVKWEDILRFNWGCIFDTAGRALDQGMDVLIDYVIEGELPKVKQLAEDHHAALYYIVLSAAEEELERRITQRGDVELIERAKYLKHKLEAMPENQGHLYDNTNKSVEDTIAEMDLEKYRVDSLRKCTTCL